MRAALWDCAQSFAEVNQASAKELAPLMARLDTLLRSLLAEFLAEGAGACTEMLPRHSCAGALRRSKRPY